MRSSVFGARARRSNRGAAFARKFLDNGAPPPQSTHNRDAPSKTQAGTFWRLAERQARRYPSRSVASLGATSATAGQSALPTSVCGRWQRGLCIRAAPSRGSNLCCNRVSTRALLMQVKSLPLGRTRFRSSPLLQTKKVHALLSRLDALYAERDDAVGEGDLDRVHELQAAITETAQQVLAAKMMNYSNQSFDWMEFRDC